MRKQTITLASFIFQLQMDRKMDTQRDIQTERQKDMQTESQTNKCAKLPVLMIVYWLASRPHSRRQRLTIDISVECKQTGRETLQVWHGHSSSLIEKRCMCDTDINSSRIHIDWLTSHQTHYRSYQGRFLQVVWPNQQCQSTEGSQLVFQTAKNRANKALQEYTYTMLQ